MDCGLDGGGFPTQGYAIRGPHAARGFPEPPAGSALLSRPSGCALWEPTFGQAAGVSRSVHALSVSDHGTGPKRYAGGTFTNAFDSGDGDSAQWGCVIDTTAPVLSCPGSVLVADAPTGPPGTIVTFSITADDDFDRGCVRQT